MKYTSLTGWQWSLATALACLAAAAAHANEFGYIFEIPATRSTASSEPLGDYIQATLNYADASQAAKLIASAGAIEVLDVSDTQVIVGIARAATTTADLDDDDLAASFVIDFDEEPVEISAALLRDSYGDQPTPQQIEQFVFDYIDDKHYQANFDFASRVARTRAGDCTEHAVLLAALARTHGLPARLVLGVVLLSRGDKITGYGHAWTEVHHDGSWQLFDGTAPESAAATDAAYYLPLMALEDEGPGYGLDFMRLVNVQPARISNIRGISR